MKWASCGGARGGAEFLRPVLAAVLGLALLVQPGAGQAQDATSPADRYVPDEGPFRGAPGSFADLSEQLIGSVVNISTSQTVARSDRIPMPEVPDGSPFQEFFEEFFQRGEPENRPRRVTSLGSGFVIDDGGIIITNNHVIADADEILVNFADGSELPAVVRGRDPQTDIAVLEVEVPEGVTLQAARFGNSDSLRVGDWVLAIGNPFGLGGTVTAGIVSAQERNINAGPYDAFIQTDASINRGNSGGPLFDMGGRVVGINTAIISPTGGSIGIGFAIPVNLARNVIDQLLEHGETRRGWLGVRIQTVTDDIARSLGMDRARGALVAGVSDGGPAGEAGIEVGDVILEFDGRRVAAMRDLPRIVADTVIGKEVEVRVLRGGDELTLDVTVGRLEESEDQRAQLLQQDTDEPGPDAPTRVEAFGIGVAELDDETRARYSLPDTAEGVVIVEVDEDGPAADAEIAEGSVIAQVQQHRISSVQDLLDEVARLRDRDAATALLLVTDASGGVGFVVVTLDSE